jgi:hypothetical protein
MDSVTTTTGQTQLATDQEEWPDERWEPTDSDWADLAAVQAEAEARRSEVYQLLLAWAEESLPSAAVPCVCSHRSCLRCRIEAIINS